MKRLPVRWSMSAYEDLLEITEFLRSESPQASLKVARQILRQISQLRRMPQQGKVVPELLEQGISMYRQILASHYRIIYRVRSSTVCIDSIVDSRRNLTDVLAQRLLR